MTRVGSSSTRPSTFSLPFRGYLDLLDKYGVRWVKLRSDNPGMIIYEDEVQVVVWHSQ